MKWYKDLKYYDVLEYIKLGKTVYLIDKERRNIQQMNRLPIDEVFSIINSVQFDNSERYQFYTNYEIGQNDACEDEKEESNA